MPQAKTPKRGAAARSEVNGKVKTVTVRGVKLTLPKTVPFRIARHLDNEEPFQYLEEVLGVQEIEKLWAIDLPTNKPMRAALVDLLTEAVGKVNDELGITSGE